MLTKNQKRYFVFLMLKRSPELFLSHAFLPLHIPHKFIFTIPSVTNFFYFWEQKRLWNTFVCLAISRCIKLSYIRGFVLSIKVFRGEIFKRLWNMLAKRIKKKKRRRMLEHIHQYFSINCWSTRITRCNYLTECIAPSTDLYVQQKKWFNTSQMNVH